MTIKGSYRDPDLIYKLSTFRMPFGKFEKSLLIDLPIPYLDWFFRQGFPAGELGQLMRIVHETKIDGLEQFFDLMRNRGADHLPDSAGN